MSITKRQFDRLYDHSHTRIIFIDYRVNPSHGEYVTRVYECRECRNLGMYEDMQECSCEYDSYQFNPETLPANYEDIKRLNRFLSNIKTRKEAAKLVIKAREQFLNGDYSGLVLTRYRMERKQKERIDNDLYLIPIRYKVSIPYSHLTPSIKTHLGNITRLESFKWDSQERFYKRVGA